LNSFCLINHFTGNIYARSGLVRPKSESKAAYVKMKKSQKESQKKFIELSTPGTTNRLVLNANLSREVLKNQAGCFFYRIWWGHGRCSLVPVGGADAAFPKECEQTPINNLTES
jgi:hypothetical protein